MNNNYLVTVSTNSAVGLLSKTPLMHDVNLGDFDLLVSPTSPDFAHAMVAISPPHFEWTPGVGLATTVRASATALANLHIHVATGKIGGGFGQDVGLTGATAVSLPVTLRVARGTSAAGNAVYLKPEFGCAPIAIDIHTAGQSLIQTDWFSLSSLSLRVRQNIGGYNMSPSLMIDSLPRIVEIQKTAQADSAFSLPHPRIQYALDPDAPVIDENSISIESRVSIHATNTKPDPNLDSKLALLRDDINAATGAAGCPSNQELDVLLGSHEIGPNNDLVKLGAMVLGTGIHIAEQTFSEAKKIATNPGQAASDFPGNAKREANNGLRNVFGSGAPQF